ncbi:hypothetical protein [Corynebacterium kalinowskii]|uniref:hypothetical protein n=1 Tax=Corynebacterium kalinowskii TaxID=2675216 RepID=UPI0012E24C28|nr:hypothetical protein [Corynebacterium kalinowskii]
MTMLKRGLAVLVASTSTLTSIATAALVAGAQDQCPAVVVVVTRDSGQNVGYGWTPTQYGASSWVSNGR